MVYTFSFGNIFQCSSNEIPTLNHFFALFNILYCNFVSIGYIIFCLYIHCLLSFGRKNCTAPHNLVYSNCYTISPLQD